MNLFNVVKGLFGECEQAAQPARPTTSLKVEGLETREVPAYLSGGNLEIVGSNSVDNVVVQDVTVGGVAKVRVNHNGVVQDFSAASVTKVRFWGYAGNDRFDYYGGESCYADGGAGDDFLSSDRGADLMFGGTGNDTLEGWGGNDELQGGDGNDVLAGGAGNDLLFGQAGNDLLGGEAGNDRIVGGTGMDNAFGGSGYDQFWEVGNDVGGLYITGHWTRFGYQGTPGGVHDADSSDDVWS